jgi:hypothetical protein
MLLNNSSLCFTTYIFLKLFDKKKVSVEEEANALRQLNDGFMNVHLYGQEKKRKGTAVTLSFVSFNEKSTRVTRF